MKEKQMLVPKLILHPKYYKHLKKSANPSGQTKMDWFVAD